MFTIELSEFIMETELNRRLWPTKQLKHYIWGSVELVCTYTVEVVRTPSFHASETCMDNVLDILHVHVLYQNTLKKHY